MKREDDQELWDLLGRTSQPAVSPFYARDVLRQIRHRSSGRDRFAPWLALRRLIPAGAIAAVVVAAGLIWQRPSVSSPAMMPEAIAQLDPIDFEVVADLDNLLALEEESLWTDGDVSTL